MAKRTWGVPLAAALGCAMLPGPGCGGGEGPSTDDDGVDGEDDGEDDGEEESDDGGEPSSLDPIVPELPEAVTLPVDCAGAYQLPDELTGPDGLGHHGWSAADVVMTDDWPVPTRFDNNWISDVDDSSPSLRVRPLVVPEAGHCYQQRIEAAADGPGAGRGAAVLRGASAFSHPELHYDELAEDAYVRASYDLEDQTALVRALRGLLELDNPLAGAPAGDGWSPALGDELLGATADYPPAFAQALADLVVAIGEAHLLTRQALAGADLEAHQRIFNQFLVESYTTVQNSLDSPSGGTVIADMIEHAEEVDLHQLQLAAQLLTRAAEGVRDAAPDPFASPGINLSTPHGRILISTDGSDDTYDQARLAGTALVIDLGGEDSYDGQYAATPQWWMSAGVLIDVRGDDRYGPGTPDIESHETQAANAFDIQHGVTQASGLYGVGVLVDGEGDDTYAASVYGQGSGTFGVGALLDRSGTDEYRLGLMGQGAGYFGSGLLLDEAGSDRYGVYTLGQGAGKPAGHGVLLDMGGDDVYIGYYNDHEPHLPGPAYPNHYGLDGSWAYNDGTQAHYMSLCQGVGWGYRGDWFGPAVSWMGGMGALLDLGDGKDEHYADTFSMGQGFMYGFGFLYDGGGDDKYRSFWWGPAASAHMGVGLLIEAGGNDDSFVTRASAGFGYDYGNAWLIDEGGNDRYGGQWHYGEGFTWGMGFFIDHAGDDVYNAEQVRNDPRYGFVRKAKSGMNLIGAFLDLGGGIDEYNTAVEGIGDGQNWYLEPAGDDADPSLHKGIGIDR